MCVCARVRMRVSRKSGFPLVLLLGTQALGPSKAVGFFPGSGQRVQCRGNAPAALESNSGALFWPTDRGKPSEGQPALSSPFHIRTGHPMVTPSHMGKGWAREECQ